MCSNIIHYIRHGCGFVFKRHEQNVQWTCNGVLSQVKYKVFFLCKVKNKTFNTPELEVCWKAYQALLSGRRVKHIQDVYNHMQI